MHRETAHDQLASILDDDDLRPQYPRVVCYDPNESIATVITDMVLRQRPRKAGARRASAQHCDAVLRHAHRLTDVGRVDSGQVGLDRPDSNVGQVTGVTAERPAP